MVSRKTTKVKQPAARKAKPRRAAKAGERGPASLGVGAEPGFSERRLELAGRTAAKLALSSVREMAAAAQAAGPPMQSIWVAFARAGRNIARDAVVAWYEFTPALKKGRQGRP
jgi:hypothetical protein